MKLLSIEDQRRLLKTSLFFSGLESLHKAVNPDILPREYGGKTYSVEECIGLWREELEHNRSTLLQLDQLKVAGVRSFSLSHQSHHKVHIYLEYHQLGPPSCKRVCFPPEPKGGGHTFRCV